MTIYDKYDDIGQYSSLDHARLQDPIQLSLPPSLAGDLQISPAHSVALPGPLPASETHVFSVKLLTFGASLKIPAWWMKAAETIPPTPSSLGEPFIPVRRSAHMRSPWPLSPKKSMEHSSVCTRVRGAYRQLPPGKWVVHLCWAEFMKYEVSQQQDLSQHQLSWHQVWRNEASVTVQLPVLHKRFDLILSNGPPNILGVQHFKRGCGKRYQRLQPCKNPFLATSHSTKCLTSPSKLDGLHVDIWNNQRKSFCWA